MSGEGGPYRSEEAIARVVRGFEECTLPFDQWTHAAHLTVGCWFLARYPRDEATERIRAGIRRYNLANGVAQTPTRGYHETITRFFIWAIARHIAAQPPGTSLLALTNALLAGPCADPRFPLDYYSRDRLMSWEARTTWVEPDLRPLSDD